MNELDYSIATAPPSVGNMAVGFDVLGHALDAPGDQVRATRTELTGVRMGSVSGCVTSLPQDPQSNTAGAGVLKLLRDQEADFGVALDVHKGVALGSGMGGSAASAVASVVAVNALLTNPLPLRELLPYALAGEQVASGCIHGDNVAPCLLGGIAFIPPDKPERCVQVPVPDGLHCVLIRPELRLDTSAGRSILSDTVQLSDVVTQTSHFGQLLCACYANDLDGLEGVFNDVLIEPQRCHQVQGFEQIKGAAMGAGAMGFSLSGSGPSVVAWVKAQNVELVEAAMLSAVSDFYDERFQCVTSKVDAPGARLIQLKEWLGD